VVHVPFLAWLHWLLIELAWFLLLLPWWYYWCCCCFVVVACCCVWEMDQQDGQYRVVVVVMMLNIGRCLVQCCDRTLFIPCQQCCCCCWVVVGSLLARRTLLLFFSGNTKSDWAKSPCCIVAALWTCCVCPLIDCIGPVLVIRNCKREKRYDWYPPIDPRRRMVFGSAGWKITIHHVHRTWPNFVEWDKDLKARNHEAN
jgi:hypothetical protein